MTQTYPSINAADLLAAMFPGDAERGLPSFESLGIKTFERLHAESSALIPYLNDHAAELSQISDINDKLKVLRKFAPEQTKAFTMTALEVYFSSPLVISALREGPAVLFPHARSLPEIDYELLEPVIERCSRSDTT